MSRRTSAGCIVVARRNGVPYMLLSELRWTRSGFKSIVHVLNGCDPETPANKRQAAMNCTNAELRRISDTLSADELWNDPAIPRSWKKIALLTARKRLPAMQAAVCDERTRRSSGGSWHRDRLSLATVVLPKGTLEADEDVFVGAVRELREEAYVQPSDVRCIQGVEPLHNFRRSLVAFVVTLDASSPCLAKDDWKIPLSCSSETIAAKWYTAAEVRAMWFPGAMRDVIQAALPRLEEYLGKADHAAGQFSQGGALDGVSSPTVQARVVIEEGQEIGEHREISADCELCSSLGWSTCQCATHKSSRSLTCLLLVYHMNVYDICMSTNHFHTSCQLVQGATYYIRSQVWRP